MTDLDVRTGGLAPMTEAEARWLTERIVASFTDWAKLVDQAYTDRVWEPLGYPSWTDYCTAEFDGRRPHLTREARPAIVESLRSSGLSVRAIAAATGTGVGTVHRDLTGVPNGTPADSAPLDPSVAGTGIPELDEALGAMETTMSESRAKWDALPDTVTGMDAKTHPAKRKPGPRRAPLPDQFDRAGWELRKAVDRLERLADDDRFGGHREAVAARIRGQVEYAAECCAHLLELIGDQA